jgi:hypothetical protein
VTSFELWYVYYSWTIGIWWHEFKQSWKGLSICTHVLQYDCFSPSCILLTACNPVDPVYSSQMLANVEWSAEWLFCAMLLQYVYTTVEQLESDDMSSNKVERD